MMKVSICVPIYGAEKYIERCAVSLFEQTYTNIEYIFVNDCTNDKSMEILLDVIKRYPARRDKVQIINHKVNRGIAAARNTLICSATGHYMMFVDSDDWIENDAVELLVEEQRQGDYDLVFAKANRYYHSYTDRVTYPNLHSAREMLIKHLKKEVESYVWGILMKMSVLSDNNIHAIEGMNSGEDTHILTQVLACSNTVSYIPVVLYHYDYSNPGSVSSLNNSKKAEEYYQYDLIIYKDVMKKKDPLLSDACNIGLFRSLLINKVMAAKNNDKEYYRKTSKRIGRISSSYYKNASWKYMFPLYVKNMNAIRAYYFITGRILHYYKTIYYSFMS